MKKIVFLVISVLFTFASCAKENIQSDGTDTGGNTSIDTISKDTTAVDTTSQIVPPTIIGYNYYGAELYTNETYKYGRFEARMKMAYAPGCISSLFLYYNDSYKGKGKIWNEIDIEVIGKDSTSFQSNIITGTAESKITSETIHALNTPANTNYHTYVIEWTPDTVRWLVDGDTIRVVANDVKAQVAALVQSQSLRFNLWASKSTGWVGVFNKDRVPVAQYIDYVKVYDYNVDTHIYTERWTDDFNTYNSTRWSKGNWQMEMVMERPENVVIEDGNLVLQLTKEPIYSK